LVESILDFMKKSKKPGGNLVPSRFRKFYNQVDITVFALLGSSDRAKCIHICDSVFFA